MSFDRDFEFSFADDVEIADHELSPLTADELEIRKGIVIRLICLFDIVNAIIANYCLLEDILTANEITSLKHPCQFLQKVLRKRGKQRYRFQKLDALIVTDFHNVGVNFMEVSARDVC